MELPEARHQGVNCTNPLCIVGIHVQNKFHDYVVTAVGAVISSGRGAGAEEDGGAPGRCRWALAAVHRSLPIHSSLGSPVCSSKDIGNMLE